MPPRHTCETQDLYIYRPQRSFCKVIFSQACVKNSVYRGVVCMTREHAWQGGGHMWQWGGCAWQGGMCSMGVCVTGGMHGRGACMAGGMCGRGVQGRGCAWGVGMYMRGMHGMGCACWGACMASKTAIVAGSMHPTGMHSCYASVIY